MARRIPTTHSSAAASKQRRKRIVSAASVLPLALGLSGHLLPSTQPADTARPQAAATSHVQAGRGFAVPLDDLQTWSQNVVVPISAQITGHSAVHPVTNDCEMHMGAQLVGYRGTPPGWVLEPMNLCLETLPKQNIKTTSDWQTLGDELTGATIEGAGVPRIWPEHLTADPQHADSNPAHATEIHPLVRLTSGNQAFDFSSFVYAPEGFDGIKPNTAGGLLTGTQATVNENNGIVQIQFSSTASIGNFAVVSVTVDRDTIQTLGGGHAMIGTAQAGSQDPANVRLVTVRGSEIDNTIDSIRKGANKLVTFDSLVLFSLNPVSLFAAAQKSHGQDVEIETPIQLILYGEPGSH